MATASKEVVKVGQVVAIERGRGRVDLARVTGMSSSGDTVDLVLLEEFVKEMYVQSKSPSTYEAIENVRPIISEYVPSQQGWIVLNQDLKTVKNYFEQRELEDVKERTVVIEAAPKEQLDEAALKRQFFQPSKTQAFYGAALSIPVSALCYSAFASSRKVYEANPAGEELLSGDVFRKLVLFSTGAGSVAALVIGCALFLYALSKSDE